MFRVQCFERGGAWFWMFYHNIFLTLQSPLTRIMSTAVIQLILNSASAGSVTTCSFYCRFWNEKASIWYVISVFVHDHEVTNIFKSCSFLGCYAAYSVVFLTDVSGQHIGPVLIGKESGYLTFEDLIYFSPATWIICSILSGLQLVTCEWSYCKSWWLVDSAS